MKRLIVFISSLIVISPAFARRVNTTRKGLKVNKANLEIAEPHDTVTGNICRQITLAGFDKPLRSNYESMFVKNLTDKHLIGLIVECNYTDNSKRQLHQRTLTIPCNIPAGQTRQVRFRSWDTQQSFYYRLSSRPRRAEAVPFDVTCTVLAVITTKAANQ